MTLDHKPRIGAPNASVTPDIFECTRTRSEVDNRLDLCKAINNGQCTYQKTQRYKINDFFRQKRPFQYHYFKCTSMPPFLKTLKICLILLLLYMIQWKNFKRWLGSQGLKFPELSKSRTPIDSRVYKAYSVARVYR